MDISRTLIEHNPDGILSFDRECRYTLWNPAMERMTGLGRDAVIGRPAFEVFPFLREIGEDKHFAAALAGQISISTDQPYRVPETGHVGYFEGHYIPLRDDSGDVVGGLGLIRDVTARHQALARAKENRELFESYMAQMPGVAFMKDAAGRHVYANRLFEETHGLAPREWDGKLDDELFPVDAAVRFRRADLAVLEADRPLREMDDRGARSDDEHWMWVKFPFSDASGRRLVAGLAFNVTEQHRAEQALRASEERFRELTENLHEIFYITDAVEKCVVYVSPAYEKIFGSSVQSLYDRPASFLDVVHPDDRWRVVSALAHQAIGEATEEEYRVQRADGTIRHVMDHAVPVLEADGTVRRVVGVVTDITDRRRAEEALALSEGRFRAIFEQAPFSVQIVDRSGHTVLANPAFESLWGSSRQVLREYNVLEDPQVISLGLVPHIRRALEGEFVALPPFYYDPGLSGLPGRPRWTEAICYPVRSNDGEVREMVLLHHDVTDRVQIEREREYVQTISDAALSHRKADDVPDVAAQRLKDILQVDVTAILLRGEHAFTVRTVPGAPELLGRQAATRGEAEELFVAAGFEHVAVLPLAVGAATIGLLVVARHGSELAPDDDRLLDALAERMALVIAHAQLVVELQQANRRKDEFLATLGHELRNPLAPLLTAAELMRVHPASDPILRQAQEVVTRQAHQMRRLIDDLLDVARITRGIVSLRLERVDLREALSEAIATARTVIESRHHQLIVSLPDKPIYADADRVRLEQIITNLLSNASKFTPRQGRIIVTLEDAGPTAAITVADTGKGIPADMLPRVFDLFTQVNPTLDRAEGGLGLGLTLVKRLVEMHGGAVAVTSAGEGMGTEFVVHLPMQRAPESTMAKAIVNADEASPPACRVLIVDDNVDSVQMLGLILPLWGYQVDMAHSGSEALERFAAFNPDIVLLDIGLPGMTGHEVARRLREDTNNHDVSLVALTGYGQAEDRRRTRESGFIAHLTKPVDPGTLRSVLSSLRRGENP